MAVRKRARTFVLSVALIFFTVYFFTATRRSSLIFSSNIVSKALERPQEPMKIADTLPVESYPEDFVEYIENAPPASDTVSSPEPSALAQTNDIDQDTDASSDVEQYSQELQGGSDAEQDSGMDGSGADTQASSYNQVHTQNDDAAMSDDQQPLSPQDAWWYEAQNVAWDFSLLTSTIKKIQRPSFFQSPAAVVKDQRTVPKPHPQKKSELYHPYPQYGSPIWQNNHRAEYVPCYGPRGKLLNESVEDQVSVYLGSSPDFPKPVFGSHKTINIDSNVCYDRFSRYGAYGYGEDEIEDVAGWVKPAKVDWTDVDWGRMQRQCTIRNAGRYDPEGTDIKAALAAAETQNDYSTFVNMPPNGTTSDIAYEPRTAILLRSYTGKVYTPNDMHNIRSMITELSLMSGGQYEVVLLVHVIDSNIPIWDDAVYEETLQANVPQEFWNIAELWNINMVKDPYHQLDDGLANVHQSQWMPIQQFSLYRPEFEYLWNWEIDSRYFGHMYELLEQMSDFGRRQPRKGIWERSERFYIPDIHGDYDTGFRKYVEDHSDPDKLVWGPVPVANVSPLGPEPPVDHPSKDNYEWGVGEEADFITLLPIFNPDGTWWVIRDDVFGYKEWTETPRRTTIITQTRISKRLLHAMHVENSEGRHMASEMFPQSVALHHGFKAVHAPHPIFSEQAWTPERMDFWFNTGQNGESGSNEESAFGWGREHRFDSLSWYYRCDLPGKMYWNWLGWAVREFGGPEHEAENGRLCLPGILLHPIKEVSENVNPDAPLPY